MLRVSKSALFCPTSTTEVANVTADLDTRCGELYAPGGDLLPAGQLGSDDAAGGGDGGRSPSGSPVSAGFARSREQFESLLSFLDGSDAAGLSHAELEDRLDRDGRELLRRLLDDHLALRAVREQRLEQVIGDEGVVRGRVETGHVRSLETVFWTVSVERLAYRAPGVGNLHPADAALNLPVERHSHGLRKLAAPEGHEPAPGPVARNKWLTASIVKAPAAVIKRVFEEAERRDPKHRRRWVALVDGANHQIERIKFEARKRAINVTIVVDFVHV